MLPSLKDGAAQPSASAGFWYALPIWLAFAALPLVAIYSFVNLVVVLLVLALGVHGWRGSRKGMGFVQSFSGHEILLFAGLWWVLICIWSVNPSDAWSTFGRLALLFAVAVAALSGISDLSWPQLRRLHTLIIVSGLVLLAIYAFELAFGAPIAGALKDVYMGDVNPNAPQEYYDRLFVERAHTKIARGAVALGALIAPVAFLLWRRTKDVKVVGLWLAASCLVALFSHMASVPVAIFCGFAASGLVLVFPKRGMTALAVSAALFTLVLPLPLQHIDRAERFGMSSESLGVSTQHRVQIYHYTASLIADRPLSGWGFRAARNLSDQAPQFIAAGYDAPFNERQTILPLHPHNMSLQLWLETGFVGVALFCGLLVMAARRVDQSRLRTSQRMLIGATGTFLFVIANLSFGIWQFHWLSLIVISAGAVLACCLRPRTTLNAGN